VKMLALSFLVLIGASLIAEGFNFHIEKPFIYGPIAFAIFVEALNLTSHSRQAKRNREEEAEPVHLREKYAAEVPSGMDQSTSPRGD